MTLIPYEPTPRRLIEAFLAGRSPRTLAAYKADVGDFAAFLGATLALGHEVSPEEAAARLVASSHGEANSIALAYRASLIERKLAPATVNRRIAALRSLVKLASTLGMIGWTLDIGGVKLQPYRDTRGPGLDAVRAMMQVCDRSDPRGVRDYAILRLLSDLGLRRGEICSLDMEHITPSAVTVLGKGKTQRVQMTLPANTEEAIRAWIEVRGDAPGPLFFSTRGRIDGSTIYRIVRRLGTTVGALARPHGLRHTAITRVLDMTKGDVRAARKFSRHKNLETLTIYDDAREDVAGELATKLSEEL